MITVNKIGNSITGSVNGKRYGVNFTEEKYAKMLELVEASENVTTVDELNEVIAEFEPLTVESYKDTVETACPYIHVNQATGKFYLKDGDNLSTFAMPKSFVDRIMTSIEKGIDILPLVKFWTRLLRNPFLTERKAERICNYVAKTYVDRDLVAELMNEHGVSLEVATERATSLQTPITKEGLLCTYKVSTEIKHKWILNDEGEKELADRYEIDREIDDVTGEITETENMPKYVEERLFQPAVMGTSGDKFFCDGIEGHVIRVGCTIKHDTWDKVNTNDGTSCVPGLHVGNLDYIRGYQHEGTETHYVFIDPRNVGAITDDGSGALRVKEYYVYASFAGVNKGIYHSSSYAKQTDAEWAVERAEAIANAQKLAQATIDALPA